MKSLRWKWTVRLVLLALSVIGVSVTHALPINLHITSSSDWLATDTDPGAGWTDVGFNDSTWINASAPYQGLPNTPGDVLPGTSAEFMWYWDASYPADGRSGPGIAWFRYEFTLDLALDSLPLIAQALMTVDDDFDLYVNGQFILGDHDHGGADDLFFVDFTSELQNGANVLAIRGIDGWSDTTGQDRLYERVLFDGQISTVPEPTTFALLGIGLAGLGVILRRHKKL